MTALRTGALATVAVLIQAVAAGGASAHDFWIDVDEACGAPVRSAPFALEAGHGLDRRRASMRPSRVRRIELIEATAEATDLRPRMTLGSGEADGRVDVRGEGTHLLVFESDTGARSHLPPDQFNAYLEAEGLTPALEHRARTGRTALAGAERFGRVAKALLRGAGGGPGGGPGDGPATRPQGLPLEIVPEIDPYHPDRADRLPVRVYWDGVPLDGARVKLVALDGADGRERHARTDAFGRVAFDVPREGRWMLGVVWTSVLPPGGDTDYETIFSSLTFGCAPGPS
ncbi:DUF4198 domain-containing protein [Brevundimonas diminuta]|uniref:Sodium:proton antiporter n=1 Tax=Brevundimonas diminuta TaxID=293 RepID=A0A1Z3LVN5_BREDI|nr:DUF4198 domain-containing protein [Brevundimonas diminuta]ASD26243.1 sodium:proton antiporter [Brevundimonas diminuta]